jgi:poly(A) polymerase Pap1
MHNTTHEDTNTSTEDNSNSIIGKRKRETNNEDMLSQKRVKLTDKLDNTVETLKKEESEEKEMSDSTCFFPQFKEEFEN